MTERDWLLARGPETTRSKLHSLAKQIAHKHNISVNDLLSDCRVRDFAWPRQEFFAEAVKLDSLSAISEMLGWDRGTIRYGCRQHLARAAGQKKRFMY